MEAPLPGASVELGVGVLEPDVEVLATVVPAALDEAVELVKVPLLTGMVTLATPEEIGTTMVVGTTTEMTLLVTDGTTMAEEAADEPATGTDVAGGAWI